MANKSGKFAIGAVFAAAAGYVTGILTAPKSGKETRKDIHDGAIKARSEAEKKLKSLHSDLQDVIKKGQTKVDSASATGKQRLNDAIENAKSAKDKAKSMLSAIHEGDSDDKDLQKAIEEADQALAHLKEYITKPEASRDTGKKK